MSNLRFRDTALPWSTTEKSRSSKDRSRPQTDTCLPFRVKQPITCGLRGLHSLANQHRILGGYKVPLTPIIMTPEEIEQARQVPDVRHSCWIAACAWALRCFTGAGNYGSIRATRASVRASSRSSLRRLSPIRRTLRAWGAITSFRKSLTPAARSREVHPRLQVLAHRRRVKLQRLATILILRLLVVVSARFRVRVRRCRVLALRLTNRPHQSQTCRRGTVVCKKGLA